MKKTSRTIIHYSLKIQQNKGLKDADPQLIKDCLVKTFALEKTQKKHEEESSKKFHILATLTDETDYMVGRFFSAKYDYRPPLIDKDSLAERDSPKAVSEGEKELTHFAITFDEDDALLLLEQKRSGVSIQALVKYLNHFIKDIAPGHSIVAGLSVKGDFNSKLKELSRAVTVEIFVPYSKYTDTFGAEPISTKHIKKEAKITLAAEKSQSIVDTGKDLYRKLTNHKADISRIKIYGKTQNNADTLLDTNRLKDKNTVQVDLDANNQVVSDSMFQALKGTMENLL